MKQDIIETIRAALSVKKSQISESTKIQKLAQDSIDVIGLIAALSSKYKIAIKPKEMNNIKTVGDIVDYVIKNQGSAKAKSSLETF